MRAAPTDAPAEIVTYRCAAPRDEPGMLRRRGASAGFVTRKARARARRLLSEAKENFAAIWSPSTLGISRYSDGSHNVLYTAMSMDVAESERSFRVIQSVFKNKTRTSFTLFLYSCHLNGKCRDYRSGLISNKAFVHPKKYGFCHKIAQNALSQRLDFIIVPSARRIGGLCVPVFARRASKIKKAIRSFELRWDAKRKVAFIGRGRSRRDITIDQVYASLRARRKANR